MNYRYRSYRFCASKLEQYFRVIDGKKIGRGAGKKDSITLEPHIRIPHVLNI